MIVDFVIVLVVAALIWAAIADMRRMRRDWKKWESWWESWRRDD